MLTVRDKPKRIVCPTPGCGQVYRFSYKKNGSPINWATECSACKGPLGTAPDPVYVRLTRYRREGAKRMAKKKVARKTATKKKATTKKATKKGVDNQAGQKDLPGVDNSRVPQLETLIKKIVETKSQRAALKEDLDEMVAKIPGLFEKHKLLNYKAHGQMVTVQPGGTEVKMKKAAAK